MFKPELFNSLKNYSTKTFVSDLIAGVIVGVVALPLAIAFAIASGVSPERGLFTAIIAGFCISFFGGSKVQIGGPTGAFAVIVYGVVNKFGYEGLVIATIMAGILLILLGAFKMGGLVKFIPYTIVTGFTAGIAVTILTGQIGDFFGLTTGKMPGDFVGKIKVYIESFNTINWYSFGIAAISLIVIFLWPKINKKVPGSLIVIILATVVSLILEHTLGWKTDTIGSRYGAIPSSLPAPTIPGINLDLIKQLFPTAISIAVLAAIESLLSAVVADGMIGSKHDSNTELIAQGIANIASPIFGGIPATGAIARTATNIKNGGKTPIAGIIHAVVLLLIMLLLGKFAVYIPMAALAAVLVQFDEVEQRFSVKYQEELRRNLEGFYAPNELESKLGDVKLQLEQVKKQKKQALEQEQQLEEEQHKISRDIEDAKQTQGTLTKTIEINRQELQHLEEELEIRHRIRAYIAWPEDKILDTNGMIEALNQKRQIVVGRMRDLERELDEKQKEKEQLTKGDVLPLPEHLKQRFDEEGIQFI
ncbi:MAG: hypothetical protein IIV07_03140, partial [Treponema sp.]|nr:hypothetical protein [Treponema sp.]